MRTLQITVTRRKIFTTAEKADLILLSNYHCNALIFTPHPHLIVNPVIWVIFFHMFNLQLRTKLWHHHLYYSCFFPIFHSLRENSLKRCDYRQKLCLLPAFAALVSGIKTLVSQYSIFITAPILTLKDISLKHSMHLCILQCPLTQLKTQHKGANPLIRGSSFLFLPHWGLRTFLLLLLTLQMEGKQCSRLGWLKYSPCKSIAQTGRRLAAFLRERFSVDNETKELDRPLKQG